MARDRPTSRLAPAVEHRGRLGHRGLDSSRLARASALAAIATRARIDGQPIGDQPLRYGSGQPVPVDRIRLSRQHPGAACRKRLYRTLPLARWTARRSGLTPPDEALARPRRSDPKAPHPPDGPTPDELRVRRRPVGEESVPRPLARPQPSAHRPLEKYSGQHRTVRPHHERQWRFAQTPAQPRG